MADRSAFLRWLGGRESGRGDPESYGVVNQLNFLGKYQLGKGMLHDLGYYDDDTGYYPGGNKTKNTWGGKWKGKNDTWSKEDYLRNKNNVQEIAFEEELGLNWRRILAEVPDANQRHSKGALLAGAHLSGTWGIIGYLKTGKVPMDENGTLMTAYMEEGGRFPNII